MCLFVIHLIPTMDIQTDETRRDWQKVLMDTFFFQIPAKHLEDMSLGAYSQRPVQDYCPWTGISCDRSVITTVSYTSVDYGQFQIESLPPTIRKIWIAFAQQRGVLSVRFFPRDVEYASVSGNEYCGHLDLTSLPHKLRTLNARTNNLSGPLVLTCLPPDMTSLDISDNNFVQNVVFYDNLPENIHYIQLITAREERNIQKIRSVNPQNKADPKVFKCVATGNVS